MKKTTGKSKLSSLLLQGYLEPVLKDEQLFTKEDAEVLFSNIRELYAFHREFVKLLKESIDQDNMDVSCVGRVFLMNVSWTGITSMSARDFSYFIDSNGP